MQRIKDLIIKAIQKPELYIPLSIRYNFEPFNSMSAIEKAHFCNKK